MSLVRKRMRARAIRIELGQAAIAGLVAAQRDLPRQSPFSTSNDPHMADAWYRAFDRAAIAKARPQ